MIRRATLQDLPDILAGEGVFPAQMRSTEEELHEILADGQSLVFHDGAYAGCVLAAPRDDVPGRRPLYIYNLAVVPERQGRGIGRALLRALIDRAARAGRSVVGHFRPTSEPLFAALGGRVICRVPWEGERAALMLLTPASRRQRRRSSRLRQPQGPILVRRSRLYRSCAGRVARCRTSSRSPAPRRRRARST